MRVDRDGVRDLLGLRCMEGRPRAEQLLAGVALGYGLGLVGAFVLVGFVLLIVCGVPGWVLGAGLVVCLLAVAWLLGGVRAVVEAVFAVAFMLLLLPRVAGSVVGIYAVCFGAMMGPSIVRLLLRRRSRPSLP